MRTDDLIEAMAADAGPVARAAPQARLALAALAGAVIALALVLVWLGLRPDLTKAMTGGFFWIKATYTGALGAAFYCACERLARPGASANRAFALAGLVLAAFAIAAVVQFIGLGVDGRSVALHGVSWKVCTRNVFVLGAPMTLIALFVLKALAPTRPGLAGFAAGAFAGGVAATVYGLHCPEATFVFVALWYTLGVVGCGVLGGVLGRFMLRW